jgi:hypothetical protein
MYTEDQLKTHRSHRIKEIIKKIQNMKIKLPSKNVLKLRGHFYRGRK